MSLFGPPSTAARLRCVGAAALSAPVRAATRAAEAPGLQQLRGTCAMGRP